MIVVHILMLLMLVGIFLLLWFGDRKFPWDE